MQAIQLDEECKVEFVGVHITAAIVAHEFALIVTGAILGAGDDRVAIESCRILGYTCLPRGPVFRAVVVETGRIAIGDCASAIVAAMQLIRDRRHFRAFTFVRTGRTGKR